VSGYYPLTQLRALLGPASARRGQVVRIIGSSVQVATAAGLVQAQAVAGLSVGQSVMVRDGVAYPSAQAGARYAL
jgi:uncharacterized RmlC-like cupin family protein